MIAFFPLLCFVLVIVCCFVLHCLGLTGGGGGGGGGGVSGIIIIQAEIFLLYIIFLLCVFYLCFSRHLHNDKVTLAEKLEGHAIRTKN